MLDAHIVPLFTAVQAVGDAGFTMASTAAGPVTSEGRHWAETLLDLPNLVFVFAFAIASVAILTGVVKSIAETREREQTRREIAAYLSQGMLTNEQAALLLSKGKTAKAIAERVMDGRGGC